MIPLSSFRVLSSVHSLLQQRISRTWYQSFVTTSSIIMKESGGKVPIVLNESDLSEKFVRGSGPGGQSVNKSNNCVQLTHIPTGIMVSAHECRELTANRKKARRKLIELLDIKMNGDESKVMKRVAKKQRRKSKSRSRSKRKYQSAAGDIEGEGEEDEVDGNEESVENENENEKREESLNRKD